MGFCTTRRLTPFRSCCFVADSLNIIEFFPLFSSKARLMFTWDYRTRFSIKNARHFFLTCDVRCIWDSIIWIRLYKWHSMRSNNTVTTIIQWSVLSMRFYKSNQKYCRSNQMCLYGELFVKLNVTYIKKIKYTFGKKKLVLKKLISFAISANLFSKSNNFICRRWISFVKACI